MRSLEERRKALKKAHPVWETMTLYQRFFKTEEACPDHVCFVDGQEYSYRQIGRMVRQAAAALERLGVSPGDCVAVMLGNRVEFLAITFALAKIGAVKVPVNKSAGAEELAYILEQTKAKVLAAEASEHHTWKEYEGLSHVICLPPWEDREGQGISWDAFLALGEGRESRLWEDGLSLSDIIYTSGSTGKPKGVMLTHDMLLRSAYASCINRGYEEGRRIYVPLPLFHVYGYVEGLLASVIVTGCILVKRGKFQAETALQFMQDQKANDILSVPFMMMKLLQCPTLEAYDLSSLYAVYCSASVCPKWVWSQLRTRLGAEEVVTGYGMTEVAGASMQTDPYDGTEILEGRVGKILEGGCAGEAKLHGAIIEYRVIDGATGLDMPPKEYGELICRGPVVTQGYYQFAEATANAVDAQGWLHTGDVGYFDENGYLRYLGRCNDIYKINGENVSPQFLDRVISKCEAVSAVETVGVPDEELGWVGAAFVELKDPSLDAERQVKEYCRETLAAFQVPKYFFFTESSTWPHTSTGKVQKFKLRELAKKRMEDGDG